MLSAPVATTTFLTGAVPAIRTSPRPARERQGDAILVAHAHNARKRRPHTSERTQEEGHMPRETKAAKRERAIAVEERMNVHYP